MMEKLHKSTSDDTTSYMYIIFYIYEYIFAYFVGRSKRIEWQYSAVSKMNFFNINFRLLSPKNGGKETS